MILAQRLERWVPRVLVLGIALYLMVFAVRFAEERLYADSGYYLFRTINGDGFHIEHGRWVLVLAEWLPLVGSGLGMGIGSIILLHSLGNVVFMLVTVAICHYKLKDPTAALTLVLLQVFGLTHGLFCPVFELYYGAGLLVLLLAVLRTEWLPARTKLLLASLLWLVVLSAHPMLWLLAPASLLYLAPRERRPDLLIFIGIGIAFGAWRWYNMSVYEAAQLGFGKRLFSGAPLLLFHPKQVATQLLRSAQHYPDVLAMSVLVASVLWKERRHHFRLFLTGLLVLYVLTGLYLADTTHDRYREQVDFAFTVWVLLVFFLSAWRTVTWRPALLLLLLVCTIYRMAEAERVAPLYTVRTQWEKELVNAARALHRSKVIIDTQGVTFGTATDHVSPYWSTGVETLLLSAADGPNRCVSVITTDDLACPGVPEHLDKVVLRCWEVLDTVDSRYFMLPEERYTRQ
jgi:hypothetical protein